MAKFLHIALGSTMSKPGDITGNLAQIAEFAYRAAKDGANLLLTPELSVSGYGGYPEVLATAEIAGQGPIYQALVKLAKSTGVVLCAGFVEAGDEKKYLAHYAVYPDRSFVVQRKHRVTPVERPLDSIFDSVLGVDESLRPVEDFRFNFFDVCGVKCVMVICADSHLKGLSKFFGSQGVEFVLGPSGSSVPRDHLLTTADLRTETGRQKYVEILQKVFFPNFPETLTESIQYGYALGAVNQCAFDEQSLYFLGHGFIFNALGECLAFFPGQPNLDRQRAMYAHAEIDMSEKISQPPNPLS